MNTAKSNKEKELVIFALTVNGRQLALKLADKWSEPVIVFVPERIKTEDTRSFEKESFKNQLQAAFVNYRKIICIMAAGIVVRSLAEVLQDKRYDPAVLVMDEKGDFVISLLSGHLGGANQLAEDIACVTGGQAVITTATDVQGVPAIDMIAQEISGWYNHFKENTRFFNRLLAEKESVALCQDKEYLRETDYFTVIPWGTALESFNDFAGSIFISNQNFFETPTNSVILVPQEYVLGIGCRKNVSFEVIQAEYIKFCQQENIHPRSVALLASIDLKKNEAGILDLAEWLEVPFQTYSTEQLQMAAERYPQSPFVKKTVGVGNVSQAAADLASKGQMISGRYQGNGVTFALGRKI